MRKIVLFAAIAMGVVGCSKTDFTETLNEQNEIRFSKAQMGNTIITKANKELAGSESFGVYAYLTVPSAETWFKEEKLSSADGGNTWSIANKYYYPTGDFTMDFWAYGKDSEKNIPTSVSATGLVYTDYTINQANAADHEAFVILKETKTVNQTAKDTPIALHFWHALSKIQFTAKLNAVAGFENVDVKITSITINTSKTGSITYSSSKSQWTQGSTEDILIKLTSKDTLTDKYKPVTESFYAIPLATDNTNTITVKADLYHKGTGIKIAETIEGTIKATAEHLKINNSVTYNIILDLSKAGLAEIKFATPTIEDWTSDNSGETTFPTTQPQP